MGSFVRDNKQSSHYEVFHHCRCCHGLRHYGYGLGHYGYGYPYAGYGYHYGKRSADAEPTADAEAGYYGGYYGHRAYGYGYPHYGYGYRAYGYGYPYAYHYGK